MLNELNLLKPKPLRSIKQVELCSKWEPLLPKEAVDKTFPKPSDEIIELVKERRKEKNRSKVSIKRW